MKKLSASYSLFICLMVLAIGVPPSWAGACGSIVLPTEIRNTLERDFSGWSVVMPELLSSPDDRQIWKENYSDECPGIIGGNFTDQHVEYVVNLIKGSGKTLEQQIILFEPSRHGFRKVVLDPPSHVDVVTVLRRFAPGVYRTPDGERSVKVAFETIGVSEIEAGTIVYYWDGKQFQHIATSE